MMRLSFVAGLNPLMCHVSYSLSCSSEDWGAIFPTYGWDKGKGYELWGSVGKRTPSFGMSSILIVIQ